MVGTRHLPWRGVLPQLGSSSRASRLVEVEDGCFEVYFRNLLLGRIHTAHPELGLIAARKVLPMSPVQALPMFPVGHRLKSMSTHGRGFR